MNVIIDKEIVQAAVNYLAQQPYHEVHQLIPALLSGKPEPQEDKTNELPTTR